MAVRNFPYRLVLPSSLHADILAKCSFKVMEPCSYVRPWGILPKNQPGFQLFWHGSWECEPDQWVHQLVSQAFCSYRINLSPFTKDFRGQEAKIEHSSIFLRLLLGSCYSTLVNYWQEELTFYTDILRRKVDLRFFFITKRFCMIRKINLSSPKSHQRMRRKKLSANSTPCSQAVTHPSTDEARRCLTSVIGREPVLSAWYGRWQENCPVISIMTPVQFDLTKTSDGQHQMAPGKRHWPKVELLWCFSKTKSCNGNPFLQEKLH